MVEICGDDLIAARRFVDLCRRHMSEMFSTGDLPMENMIFRLAEIQDQAKLMRARYIYKSVQTVIDELSARRSAKDCASSVLILQKLITQYEGGLLEISPANTRMTKRAKTNPVGPVIVTELSQQIEAAKTLTPLIQYADRDDRSGLIKLVSLAANQGGKDTPNKFEKFDVIYPTLTNAWLRKARGLGKSVSVSTSADDVLVDLDTLNKVQSALKAVGELLISESVQAPNALEEQGLSRTAHMALTARLDKNSLAVQLSCRGQNIADGVIEELSQEIRRAGFTSYLLPQNGALRFEIRDIKAKPAGSSEREVAL